MAVRFSPHALESMRERGVTQEEVETTLLEGEIAEARAPRQARARVFTQGYVWEHRRYPHKRVRVIYAEVREDTVVVTVYGYYGRWEEGT